MTTMKSKFGGKCAVCGKTIATGELMVYDKANKKCYCMAHNPEKTTPTAGKVAIQPKTVSTHVAVPIPAPKSSVSTAEYVAALDQAILALTSLKAVILKNGGSN